MKKLILLVVTIITATLVLFILSTCNGSIDNNYNTAIRVYNHTNASTIQHLFIDSTRFGAISPGEDSGDYKFFLPGEHILKYELIPTGEASSSSMQQQTRGTTLDYNPFSTPAPTAAPPKPIATPGYDSSSSTITIPCCTNYAIIINDDTVRLREE